MIASPTNPKIKHIRALQRQRKTRAADGVFVVEGVRLVEEAAQVAQRVTQAFYTADLDARGQAVVQTLQHQNVPVELVSPAVMTAMSDTLTPAGILAVVALPPAPALRPPTGRLLLLDGLGDPGNLGTILRTAEAVGLEAVWLMPGTVDAYNPKVVRAAMGAHLRLSIVSMTWDEAQPLLAHCPVWLADAATGEPYHRVPWAAPCALIIGAEAAGPSAAARAFTPHRVHIPMPGRAESLNAALAAAVLLFEMVRPGI